MGKLFILGIDGFSFSQFKTLKEKGIIPNLVSLADQNTAACMNSSLPEVSSVAWASIVTGKNPGEHNIYGFTDIIDHSYTLGFTSSKTNKEEPFWQWNKDEEHLIINVPQTYPAKTMSGILVSGYVALDLERSVYPAEMLDFFNEKDYRIDVDMSVINESKERFLHELNETLDIRFSVLKDLLDKKNWKSIMFVVTGTDRLSHYMWDQWENDQSEFHSDYLDFYRKVDNIVGGINGWLEDDDVLCIVSDHGFEPQKYSININRVLIDNGFLDFEPGERKTYSSMKPSSKAFCMDPGRIYIHRESRFPNGKVKDSDCDHLSEEIGELLDNYKHDGEKIVSSLYYGKDIYSGPYAHRGPEIIALSAPGVSFSGRLQTDDLIEASIISGKHRFNDAFFLYKGKYPVQQPDKFAVGNVMDIVRETGILYE